MTDSFDPRFLPLYDLPGHVFRRAWQHSAAGFEKETAGLPLTGGQFSALMAISIRPGMEQQELSSVIHYDAATTGGVVRRLEALGAVRRQASGRSRRGRALYLTPEGEALLERAIPIIERVSRRLLRNLDPEESRKLLSLLSKVARLANSYHQPAQD